MEARFAQLEALVTSMATQVKSTAFGPEKAKNRENEQSYGSNTNQGFFNGTSFSRSVAPNEMMSHMSRDHESWVANDGNHVMVPNPNEMISTTTPMTRDSTWVLEP
jgi:hypothetical protein